MGRQLKPGQLQTGSLYNISASNALTASHLNTLNQDLTFNGNLTLNGTASITRLNVIYETASVLYSSGSNQFGDSATDTQTLLGRTIVSGSLEVTQSIYLANPGIGSIYFTGSGFPGRMTWNSTDGTVDLGMGYDSVTQQIGQELYNPPVVNKSGADLPDGTLVMVNPNGIAQGQRISVIPMIGNGTYPADYIVGVLTMDIPNNQTGLATWFGYVRNINASHLIPAGETWAEGNVLYPHPTQPGYMTNIQPTAPNIKSTIAAITAINGTNITLMVRPSLNGTLGALHNINDSTTTSSYGDLLIKSGSIWKNSKQLIGSYGLTGDLTATSFTGSLHGTSSYALTASYAMNGGGGGGAGFPYSGSAEITGSLLISGSGLIVIGNTSITGSLYGTSSWAENFDTSSIQTQVNSLSASTASYVLIANTASMLQPYVLTTTTSSMLQPYVLTSTTQSMLQPYVLTASTSSMLQPYVLTASTSSMTVLSSSYATNSDVAVKVTATNLVFNDAETYPIVSYTIPSGDNGSPIFLRTPGGTSGTNNLSFNPARGRITVTTVSASSFTSSLLSGVGFVGTASWSQTASYVASANVVGPYGSNSITSASYAVTTSYAHRANSVNTLDQNVIISGSLTVVGASTFYGTSSFTAVTASQLYISQSYISVNIFEPIQRFGGLYVYDSGSSNATASLTWDSLNDRWIYTNASGSAYEGSMLLAGPRNYGELGNEPALTRWFIPRGDGDEHLNDTQIYSSESIHIITGSLTVTAGVTASLLGNVTGSLHGTASFASFAETVTRYTRWHVYDNIVSASIGKTYDYNGYAVVGTALTDNAWTITRLVITASGAVVARSTVSNTNWNATGSAFT